MNIAVIFAGGTGQRMGNQACPKQFLKVHGKPILAYTLEKYQQNEQIQAIVIASLEKWIPECWQIAETYHFSKVRSVVPGGATGQESIYNGLREAASLFGEDHYVLIHDGVRPLVAQQTIDRAIECVHKNRSAVTVAPAVETVVIRDSEDTIGKVLDRSRCLLAKAPQCFCLGDILAVHERARAEGRNDFIDSAMLMSHYGHRLCTIEGNAENIKITKPIDYYIFKAILDGTGKDEND